MDVGLRAARSDDFIYARIYFETMRWIIERLFGWDQAREEHNFAKFFKLDEVSIISCDGKDVGWIQVELEGPTIYIDSFYITSAMQRRGIGTEILERLLAQAKDRSKAITLACVKFNPALSLYKRHGFRITHEDEHKFYLRVDP